MKILNTNKASKILLIQKQNLRTSRQATELSVYVYDIENAYPYGGWFVCQTSAWRPQSEFMKLRVGTKRINQFTIIFPFSLISLFILFNNSWKQCVESEKKIREVMDWLHKCRAQYK